MPRTHHTAAARSLALLRVAGGTVFLVAGIGKMAWLSGTPLPVVSATWQREFPARLATWLSQHPDGVSGAIVRDLLLPNGRFVAGSVAWLQLVAGALLIAGLFTRAASVVAAVLALALALAASARAGVDARPYLLLFAMAIAFLLGRAGDVLGLDGTRNERRRNREL
jgi:uncharacterized membrane protein YphA (DoxX/SURF4 family)